MPKFNRQKIQYEYVTTNEVQKLNDEKRKISIILNGNPLL